MATSAHGRASYEEDMFAEWCREARDKGLLAEVYEQPVTWEILPKQTVQVKKKLKTKTKKVDRHICASHKYTPDFLIYLTSEGERRLSSVFYKGSLTKDYRKHKRIYVDVKGAFTVQRGQEQIFSVNRKLILWFHSVWVEKVIPFAGNKKCLFKDTWCPELYRYKKNQTVPTLTKKGEMCPTLEQFIQGDTKGE